MLIVNQGTNDQYFIFRGGDAAEFLSKLELTGTREVIVVVSKDRFERGRLAFTKALTALLVLSCEDLTDEQAREAFDRTLDAHVIDATRGRAIARS